MTRTRPSRHTELLPDERKVVERLGHLPLDFRAMWAISNLFRSSTAIRRHMEAVVLAHDRLSWTSFVGLWVLWVWGPMEARAFASAVGISRPTATGVMTTLESRGFVTRRKDPKDGRMVIVELTRSGRSTIERLFPKFNAEEGHGASRARAKLSPNAAVVIIHPRGIPPPNSVILGLVPRTRRRGGLSGLRPSSSRGPASS